jgi:hypothetical protein
MTSNFSEISFLPGESHVIKPAGNLSLESKWNQFLGDGDSMPDVCENNSPNLEEGHAEFLSFLGCERSRAECYPVSSDIFNVDDDPDNSCGNAAAV